MKDDFAKLVERTREMETVIPKQAYSRPIQFKRHLINQKKINDFLEANLFAAEAEAGHIDDAESYMTTPSERQNAWIDPKTITYKMLLEHLEKAEKHYDNMRAQNDGRMGPPNDTQSGTEPDLQTQNSNRY